MSRLFLYDEILVFFEITGHFSFFDNYTSGIFFIAVKVIAVELIIHSFCIIVIYMPSVAVLTYMRNFIKVKRLFKSAFIKAVVYKVG